MLFRSQPHEIAVKTVAIITSIEALNAIYTELKNYIPSPVITVDPILKNLHTMAMPSITYPTDNKLVAIFLIFSIEALI